MVAVTIGDSTEEYKLLLDSAASNTWVMGEGCSTEACGKHNTFGKGDSKTIKTDPKTFSVTYGTGSVSGTTASDTLHIGNSLSTSMSFGVATNVSSEFLSYPMDGIIGLGRGTTSDGDTSAPLLIDALSSAKLISSKIYGLHLGRASDNKNDGELNLGDVNKDRFDGDLNWLSASNSDRGFWEVDIADVGFDTKTVGGVTGKVGIIDTGTSYFFMPPTEAATLHKLIDGSTQDGESFQVPCSTTAPVTLKFGSTTYNMSSADWVGSKGNSGLCNSKIVGRATFGSDRWLIGDAFLKNVYTVFDVDNSKIGFGVKSAGSNDSSSTTSTTSSSTSASPSGSGTSATSTVGTPSSATTRTSSSSASPAHDTPTSSSKPSTNPSPPSGSSTSNSPSSASGAASPSEAAGNSGVHTLNVVSYSASAASIVLALFAVFL
ncbi:acid protease [Massarina eburnea CBS 473.64]|uniref:Acid protease n=1 Tax=Massarina eburnea CBS 473.64 TaxID=1395130 RepID=A0A6A6S894_9PLEO|nr:acid protease [Massarina eburnea CBS 473.64]